MTDTVASLRDQLLQIKALHDAGALATPAYDSARAGLERRLVDLVTAGADGVRADGLHAGGLHAEQGAQTSAEPRAGKGLWAGTLLVAAAVAAGGYAWTGSPAAIGTASAPAADVNANAGAGNNAASAQGVTPQQIAAMVERLAARLTDKPDDAEGWRMLGRSYMVLDKPAEAVTAFGRYLKLKPADAGGMADQADALAASSRSLEGEPLQLLQRALALEPGNQKALMLVGTAAFNRGDYAAAVAPWDRIVQAGPADDPLVQQAVLAVEEARRRGKLPPAIAGTAAISGAPIVAASAATSASTSDTVAAAALAVSGTVSLDPALQARAAPGDTVFIFARPAEGARMPLAIVRKQVKDLPFDFRLDDSLAMSTAARISAAEQVVVGARISKSGQATPQPGDLQGLTQPLAVGSGGIRLVISAVVP